MPDRPRKLSLRTARPAHGFTLVELMVVLVIIAILGGLIVVGITNVIGGTRDDSTESRMEMLDSFLAAYANAENARAGGQGNTEANELPSMLRAGPDPQPAGRYSTVDSMADDHDGIAPMPAMKFNGEPLTAPNPSASPPSLPDPSDSPPYLPPLDPTRYPPRFAEDNWVIEPAVARTQAVLRRLLTIPANQSTFASLPADAKTRIHATRYPTPSDPSILNPADLGAFTNGEPSALNPPIIVDGHGNPIIYVPPSGLTGLLFKDGTRVEFNAPANQPYRLVAVHAGAFWASAGADGIFGYERQKGSDNAYFTPDDVLVPGADDNVYSTEVIVQKKPPGSPPVP